MTPNTLKTFSHHSVKLLLSSETLPKNELNCSESRFFLGLQLEAFLTIIILVVLAKLET